MRPKSQLRRGIGDLAGRQHGVVARRQLLALGLSAHSIKRLLRDGALRPTHNGVYAVGHRLLTNEGRWMAAVLSGGPDAVLSHTAAAMNWQLLSPFPSLPSVTTPVKGRRRPGISHHTSYIPSDEVTTHDRIPTTTVARTLLDLAAILDPLRLERAIAEAEFHRYADSPSLPQLIDRYPRRPGRARLRAVLASGNADLGVARSPLEERFLRFLDARRLPRPELNAAVDLGDRMIYVDCLWRPPRPAVELDGRASHERRRTFEADRRRDRRLATIGLRAIRITSQELDADPDGLEADLRKLGVDADTVRA